MKSTWFFLLALAFGVSFFSCTSDSKSAVATASVPPSTTGTVVPVAAKTPAGVTGTRSAAEMVAAGFKRYGVEKGALIFRIDGAVQGTEHIFFDNWGWREAKYTRTTTELGTFNEKTNEEQYLEGERRYVYFPETNKAQYFDSQQIMAMADKYQTKDLVVVGNEMLKNMGAVPVGKAKVG
ncbi:MAG: hypothetical protein HY842_17475, partial [Bacteroidetes bacterium]|nr:hypothetical protein [Bacteroidota bacterium]